MALHQPVSLMREIDDLPAAAVAIAQSLDIATLAEGVETYWQFGLLKIMSCDQIQGYYFRKPLQADEFLVYYNAHV